MTTFAVRLVLEAGFDEDAQIVFADRFDGLVAESFDRFLVFMYVDGESGVKAAMNAISSIEAVMGVRVIELDRDLVNMSDIAARIGRSRQNVQQLVTQERGPGGFPPPTGAPGGTRVWSWGAIFPWLLQHELVDADEEPPLTPEEANIVAGWLASRTCREDLQQSEYQLWGDGQNWTTQILTATLHKAALVHDARGLNVVPERPLAKLRSAAMHRPVDFTVSSFDVDLESVALVHFDE